MERKYKAEKYILIRSHKKEVNKKEPWENHPAYTTSAVRFRIVSTETGEILDDAQGYGYRTPQKAYAGYTYKNRDKSKDQERIKKVRHIEKWLKENKSFSNLMEDIAFDIIKGSMGADAKFNTNLVKQLLKENNLEPDFTAYELLKVWKNRKF